MRTPSTEDFYRQIHTGNPGDVEFYTRLVSGEEDVLELGCGWGRMTAPLSEKSRSILGLDESERFCEMARETLSPHPNARVLRHDIRTPFAESPVGGEGGGQNAFDRIFAPYNLLYALGGEAEVTKALQFVSARLKPDGEFWFDVYPMDELQLALDEGATTPDDDDEPVATFHWQGRSYPVLESSSLDAPGQRLSVSYRAVDPNAPDQTYFESSLEHHYLLIPQLEELLMGVGLEISLLLGDFEGRPYDEDADQLVFCARRS